MNRELNRHYWLAVRLISNFFSLRPVGVYLECQGQPNLSRSVSIALGCNSHDCAYFKSFSIRSTCVMTMRRQQYRLQPILSSASLDGPPLSAMIE